MSIENDIKIKEAESLYHHLDKEASRLETLFFDLVTTSGLPVVLAKQIQKAHFAAAEASGAKVTAEVYLQHLQMDQEQWEEWVAKNTHKLDNEPE